MMETDALGLESFAQNSEKKSFPLLPQTIQNQADYAEWSVRAELGLYPQDHSVTLYAQQALEKVGGAPDGNKPDITVYKGAPNAFIFQNGSVYVSDSLLELADNQEQVLFVLMHERMHHLEDHIAKQHKATSDPEMSLKKQLGINRFHEWEGDLKAFVELDKLGINPLPGADFLEKLPGGDLVHGKSSDRALNLRGVTYLKDLRSIQNPVHPIPDEIKDAIAQEKSEKKFDSPYKDFISDIERGKQLLSRRIEAMSFDQALVCLTELNQRYVKCVSIDRGERGRNYQLAVLYRQQMPAVAKKIWEEIAQKQTSESSNQRNTMLFHLIADTTGGLETTLPTVEDVLFDSKSALTKIHNPKTGRDYTWDKRNFGFSEQLYAREDVSELLELIDPEIFTALGLKIGKFPESTIENLVKIVLKKGIFDDETTGRLDIVAFSNFANRLIGKFQSLVEAHGTFEFDPMETREAILSTALNIVSPDFKDNLETTTIQAKDVEHDDMLVKNALQAFANFSAECQNFSSQKASGLKPNAVSTHDISQSWNKILEESAPQSPQDVLRFFAEFRKALRDDSELWKRHGDFEDDWNWVIESAIRENRLIQEMFADKLDSTLFDFKLKLLLGHDNGSSVFSEGLPISADEKITVDWYRQLYRLYTDKNELSSEIGIEIATPVLSVPLVGYFSTWECEMKELKLRMLSGCADELTKEDFFNLLESATNEYPFQHMGSRPLDDEIGLESDELRAKRSMLLKVFTNYTFDLTNGQDLRGLYFLSTYFDDYAQAIRVQNIVWEKFGEHLGFEQGFELLVTELEKKRLISFSAISDFVEKNATTHDEIERASERLLGFISNDTLDSLGKLMVGEKLAEQFFGSNKLDFLIACLGNGQDDSLLKNHLYTKWVGSMDYDRTQTVDNVHLNDMIHKLYRLDAQSKYVLIRDLLTGKNGVLMGENSSDRVKFVDFFLNTYVSTSNEKDKEFFDGIVQVMRQVAKSASYDLLYFALSPLIQERILIEPQSHVSWRTVIQTEVPPQGYAFDVYRTEHLDDEDEEDVRVYNQDNDEIYDYDLYQTPLSLDDDDDQVRVSDEDTETLFGYINGTERAIPEFEDGMMQRREYEAIVGVLLSDIEATPQIKKMSVNEFVLEVAQKMGAPGVRFLQLAGQYIELSPELSEDFNRVYDKVGGQSKVTAQQTLMREWPEGREFLTGLEARLGGGSLMSVFKTVDNSGKEYAVKILNPNSGHHTETTHKLITEVFSILAKEDERFVPSLALLQDIRDWIDGDINFEGFMNEDEKFRKKHQGFSVKQNRYKVKIPHLYPPANKYFQLEEFIDGDNLTEWEKLESNGHDTKQITQLLVHSFFEQIKDGRVHSDIHPGNVRVTSKNEVALLDRNFYVNLTLGDKLFLRSLTSSMKNPAKAVDSCINYLKKQGVAIDAQTQNEVRDEISSLDKDADIVQKLLSLAVSLRKQNIQFPLKITLLIKNFYYLDKMAKRAGYTGIADAHSS